MSTQEKNSNKINIDKKKLLMIIGCIAVVVAIVVVIILITGDRSVKTTVPKKYADGYADKYASSKTVDEDGNVTYEFEEDQYTAFYNSYHEVVKEESREKLETAHKYTHYNLRETAEDGSYGIVVGIDKEDYDKIGQEALKAEAKELGLAAIKFQMNTEDPLKEIPVSYKDAANGNVFFTITVTAE